MSILLASFGQGRRAALLFCTALVLPAVHAQTAVPSAAPASASAASAPSLPASAPGRGTGTTLPPVLITGNPLRSGEPSRPASVLQGDALTLRRGSTLGDTLAREPGVAQTGFGPNASRPVIRGLDGDRIRILSNAGASVDASALSFDHAVPLDPLVVERLEVLRGPAALLYGGSAIGGVVNAIDNRIPRTPVDTWQGSTEGRLGGADRERSASVLLESGNGTWAWHADAFARRTSNLVVPRHRPVEADGTTLPSTDRIRNSAARASGGALGAAWTFADGHVGASFDAYDNDYGVVAEPDVTIRMKRRHVAIDGEWRDLGGIFRAVRVQAHDTRYTHAEVEGDGTIGTTFDANGPELRVEAEHAPVGPLKGVFGAQYENVGFTALGEEAFVPSTRTRKLAAFWLEEAATSWGTWTGGLRVERVRVASAGDADGEEPRFGAARSRRFDLTSASIGHAVTLAPGWRLETLLGRTGRAPTSFELFADGLHAATGTYERGDPSLGAERGINLDVALTWAREGSRVRIGAWSGRFARYIALRRDGTTATVDGDDGAETVDVYAFSAVRARLAGFEAEAAHRVVASGWTLDLEGKLDAVRGTDRDRGEPLPRLPPLRATLAAALGQGAWQARVEWALAARQRRVPADDRPTAGYGLLDVTLSRRFDAGQLSALAWVKVGNVFDQLAYNAATVDSIRGLVPQAGRSVRAGLRMTF